MSTAAVLRNSATLRRSSATVLRSASTALRDSATVHAYARAMRARLAGVLAAQLWKNARRAFEQLRDSYARYRAEMATRRELESLDDRGLRDLGLDRSEVRSVAAEVGGMAERTRIQTLHLGA